MSTSPSRLQLSRKRGFRLPENAVNLARPGRWGNPFVVGEYSDRDKLGYGTPEELCGVFVRDNGHAAALFDKWLFSLSDVALAWRISAHVLRGHDLYCWCRVGEPCHGETLLNFANK